MNFLVIRPEEVSGGRQALLVGARAEHLREVHQLHAGMSVAALVLGGRAGQATVRELSDSRALLDLELTRDPPAREPIAAIVAVPRPQSIKKVLQIAATTGLSAVHFVKSDLTEKNYLQSKMLRPEEIEAELFKGLEQSGDAVLPQIAVHRSSALFVREILPSLLAAKPTALFADTMAPAGAPLPKASQPSAPVLLAIGPEAGWSAQERAAFSDAGFHAVSLGPRMLRVDTALAVLVGRVQELRYCANRL